jgi:hypothetical protein
METRSSRPSSYYRPREEHGDNASDPDCQNIYFIRRGNISTSMSEKIETIQLELSQNWYAPAPHDLNWETQI